MSAHFDVTLRLAPEVRAFIRETDRLLNRMRQAGLPPGAEPPMGLPRELVDGLHAENRSTALLFTDTDDGLRIRSAVGGGSVDAVLEILDAAGARFGREAVQAGNEPALAAILLSPLLAVATPETLRAAQDRLEAQAGAKVSFVSLHAGEIVEAHDPDLATGQAEIAHEAILAARKGLLSVGRSGRSVMAIEVAQDVIRRSVQAEFENRLEDPEEDDEFAP